MKKIVVPIVHEKQPAQSVRVKVLPEPAQARAVRVKVLQKRRT